jgi:hypothetical protein
MAWEVRPGGRFYYQSERCGNKVIKRYFGRGPTGELAALLDAQSRRKREQEAAAIQSERERLAPPEIALAKFDDVCNVLFEATMMVAGFHRPNYSAWRLRRERRSPTSQSRRPEMRRSSKPTSQRSERVLPRHDTSRRSAP